MVEGMWQNWDSIAGGVVNWSNYFGGQFGTMLKGLKDCLPFDPVIPLLCLYPKKIIGKMTCTKIFIATFSVVAKNWKMRECPTIGEWLNKLWYLLVKEYYCAQRNNELEKFHMNWNDLQELMQTERSRTRRTFIQRLIHCGSIEHNGLLH